VALKTVAATLASGSEDRQLFERRFFAEARIAARLSHPGIVIIHDVGRDEESGLLFIALEHLRGTTLAERVKAGALDWREALRVVAAVADALHYAHARKIVHLDVKPANIMVLPNGQPKLMDFGIARIETARLRLTAGADFFGTPLFMSPEQALGRTADARADVFALGSVLYTLVTGRHAFEAEGITAILTRVIADDPEPPTRRVPGLPPEVDVVAARAMAKSLDDRYPAAGLLAEDARDVLAGRAPRHASGWRAAPRSVAPAAPSPSLDSIDESELEPLLEAIEPVETGAPAAGAPARPSVSGGGPGEPTWVSAVAMPPTEVRDDRERQRQAARRARILKRAAAVIAVAAVAALLWRGRPSTNGDRPAASAVTPVLGGAGSVPRAAAGATGTRPPPAPAVVPARLLVDFEHPLRTGRLRVWVDEQLLLDEGLSGRVARKLIVKVRQGGLQQELDLPPGRHDIRVQVLWDDNEKTERIFGTFKEGEARRLEVRLGRLRKNLSVDWK
jgi:serine/threonine-protein kinase